MTPLTTFDKTQITSDLNFVIICETHNAMARNAKISGNLYLIDQFEDEQEAKTALFDLAINQSDNIQLSDCGEKAMNWWNSTELMTMGESYFSYDGKTYRIESLDELNDHTVERIAYMLPDYFEVTELDEVEED